MQMPTLPNRFRGAVKTTTIRVPATTMMVEDPENPEAMIEVEDSPAFEYVTRYQGQKSIVETVTAYEGLDVIIEDVVDTITSVPELKKLKFEKGKEREFMMEIVGLLQQSGFSIAQVVRKVVTKAPGLISDLIVAGAVLHEGETEQDFLDWLDTLTITQIIAILKQWYGFNLEAGLRPLLAGLGDQAKKDQAPAAPKVALRPKTLRR